MALQQRQHRKRQLSSFLLFLAGRSPILVSRFSLARVVSISVPCRPPIHFFFVTVLFGLVVVFPASWNMATMDDEPIFDSGNAGSSATIPVQCSALRKGGYVMIKGRPCKVVEMSTSKTGKHGHAKVHLVAMDIFTSKKYEDLCPSTHNIDVPNVTRLEYTVGHRLLYGQVFSNLSIQLVDIDDGFVTLMHEKSAETRSDLRLPEGELGDKIREDFENGLSVVVSFLTCTLCMY